MNTFPTINLVLTGQNISRLREQRGLTVRNLQDALGFATPQAIYKWQHGTTLPSIDNLVALSVILCVSIDDILIVDSCSDQAV